MRKRLPLVSLLLLVSIAACLFASGDGSSSDPLATLSYINGVFRPQIRERIDAAANAAMDTLSADTLARFDAMLASKDASGVAGAVEAAVTAKLLEKGASGLFSGAYEEITLQTGDSLSGGLGVRFLLRQGSAQLNGDFINVTVGAAASSGQAAGIGSCYLSGGDTGSVTALADRTTVCVLGPHAVTRAYTPVYTDLAEGLRTLGLFLGTNSGFELDRAATRIEALVMLIRLLGEEQRALSCTDPNPFTDVDLWADRYAAYAYARGYTKGRSATRFDSAGSVSFDEYVTFLLRALGYDDAAGDFVWSSASVSAVTAGLMSKQQRAGIAASRFRRDQVVMLSANALFTPIKGGSALLSDRLIADGAISSSLFDKERDRLSAALS